MMGAPVNISNAFWRPDRLGLARHSFDFVQCSIGHSWREERLLFHGLASDFAFMTRAASVPLPDHRTRSFLDQALTWQAVLDRPYATPTPALIS